MSGRFEHMPPRILIADDDSHIRDVVRFALEKADMVVEAVADGAAVLAAFRRNVPDLIVLDVGMPELDGLDVCREIRKTSSVPVLFLSARDEEIDRILGLEMGGDDYVAKPFSPRELVARVKAILRRGMLAAAPLTTEAAALKHGALELDTVAHVARLDGVVVELTALEFSIVRTFLEQKHRAFNREQIMAAAWPVNVHVAERTVDSHVRNIRATFARLGCDSVIDTVHGIGFRLGECRKKA
jgi:two-component system, OmpR family, response regulator